MTSAARFFRADRIRDRGAAAYPGEQAGRSAGAKHDGEGRMVGDMTGLRADIGWRRPPLPASYAAGYAGLSNSS
jgi:hypothetical protein